MFVMYICAIGLFLSRVLATFWLGVEQCSNRRWNLVPYGALVVTLWTCYGAL